MARVLGIGGVFFKCKDPKELTAWYGRWLGVPVDEGGYVSFRPEAMPPGSLGVFSPFPDDTEYFDPSPKDFMFNLVVDDLDGALAQVQEGGAQVVGEIEAIEYGRFGWFLDPAGNKVELWEPALEPESGDA